MPRKTLFLFQPEGDPGGGSGEGGGNGGGDPGGQTPPAPQAGTSDSQVEELKQQLAETRKEAAKHRKEKSDLAKRVEELEGASKSEVEKLTDGHKKLSEENTGLKQENRNLRVRVLAGKVGIVPEARADAARLLDWDSVKNPDEDDAIEEALRELVKDRPFLLGNVPGGADGGAGAGQGGSAQTTDMNAAIRQAAGVTAR